MPTFRSIATISFLFSWLFTTPVLHAERKSPANNTDQKQADFFEKRIRPLLVSKCLSCHGDKKQESGLRLDSRAAILKGSAEGPVVVPGKVTRSSLIEAIEFRGEIKMPPKGKLSQREIADIKLWIRQGLPWPKSATLTNEQSTQATASHWAFQPIRSPQVPSVKNRDWARTPVDRFILAKLEAAGLSPSSETDKRTLIRRVTFDLTGLPPTPEEIQQFLADDSPNAYEKLVDRLLASPRYGERWARYWLDVARYADNKGYVFLEDKNFYWAYTYRDYVIRALNDDQPYDRFLLEQLAADQIPGRSDRRYLAAMGFLTLGGRFMNNLHDILDDRIDVVSRGLMGVTITCARCHDHKFDPFTQADYYGLYGVFRSSIEPTVRPMISSPPNTKEYAAFSKGLQQRVDKLQKFIDEKFNALVESSKTRVAEYLVRVRARRNQPNTERFMLLTGAGELHPLMVQRWTRYLAQSRRKPFDPVWGLWHRFAKLPDKGFEQQAAKLMAELRRDPNQHSKINPILWKSFQSGKPIRSIQDVANRYSQILNGIEKEWNQRTANSKNKVDSFADPAREQLRLVFHSPNSPPNITKKLGWGFLSLLPDRPAQGVFKKLIKDVEDWSIKGPGAPPRAMVLVDTQEAYQPRVFLRGNPNRPGKPVPRQFPVALLKSAKPFRQGSGRLELARAIVDKHNPLTARVIVNRLWMWHFGKPLVATPSDFGLRSNPPSHPQLLDYLASEFMKNGWSFKWFHRLILLSATYRQQSADRPDCRTRDPENRLYWRMNRRRLDLEAMRDSLLAVADFAGQKIGGKPATILSGKIVPRRTIYGFVDRMNLPGLHRTFDFPSPASTSPKRETTTIPPQALFFMNHALVRNVSQRVIASSQFQRQSNRTGKVRLLYQKLFGREPTQTEQNLAKQFLGERNSVAEWTQYVQALLMSNEFLFID
ncbi:MAG: PSD1 and planctomycete cytochrome C domain-containing protein [Planctomycetaceae bacterium]